MIVIDNADCDPWLAEAFTNLDNRGTISLTNLDNIGTISLTNLDKLGSVLLAHFDNRVNLLLQVHVRIQQNLLQSNTKGIFNKAKLVSRNCCITLLSVKVTNSNSSFVKFGYKNEEGNTCMTSK